MYDTPPILSQFLLNHRNQAARFHLAGLSTPTDGVVLESDSDFVKVETESGVTILSLKHVLKVEPQEQTAIEPSGLPNVAAGN